MDFDELFGPKPDVIDLRAENRWEAIDELITYLVTTRQIKTEHREAIAQSVRKRESLLSTGVGYGVGIPHAKTALIDDTVGVMGRSRKGIEFDALDGKPVDLVILVIVPEGNVQKHLQTMANIARFVSRSEFRDVLRPRLFSS